METLFIPIFLLLIWAMAALLKRHMAKEERREAEEKPEHRASIDEVRRFLRDLGLEEEEKLEGPTLRRPGRPGVSQRPPEAGPEPPPKPAEPSLIEEGREPRPAPRAEPLPALEPVSRPEVKPKEAERVPLLEAVSEREPLVREAPRPTVPAGRQGRVVRRPPPRPPRPVWARKAAPPPVKKEVPRVPKILPVTLADLPRAVVMAEILGRPRGFSPYRPYVPPWHRGAEKK